MLTQSEIKTLIRSREELFLLCHSRPVVIYGAADGADKVIRYLRLHGIEPAACAVDPAYLPANPCKCLQDGGQTLEYPIYSTEDLKSHYPEFITAQACDPGRGLIMLPGQLRSFIPWGFAGFHTPDYFSEDFMNRNLESLRKLESELSDEKSVRLLDAFMKAMISYDLSYLKNLWSFPQYFHPDFLDFTDRETAVDCGAFDGDTLRAFLDRTNHHFQGYHALEPDPVNFRKLEACAKSLDTSRIKVYPCGTGAEEAILNFTSSEDSAAGFKQDGTIKVKVNSLDHLIPDEPVSFIKMDVEGAELDSLKGAAGIIRRNKPKLAICVYHKDEDLITIPAYIKSLVPEYQFKLGYHSYREIELVLYAYLPQ